MGGPGLTVHHVTAEGVFSHECVSVPLRGLINTTSYLMGEPPRPNETKQHSKLGMMCRNWETRKDYSVGGNTQQYNCGGKLESQRIKSRVTTV